MDKINEMVVRQELQSMFQNEWLYDHPSVYRLLCKMLNIVDSCPRFAEEICHIITGEEFNKGQVYSARSIVIVAHILTSQRKCFCKLNELKELVEEIKMFSL